MWECPLLAFLPPTPLSGSGKQASFLPVGGSGGAPFSSPGGNSMKAQPRPDPTPLTYQPTSATAGPPQAIAESSLDTLDAFILQQTATQLGDMGMGMGIDIPVGTPARPKRAPKRSSSFRQPSSGSYPAASAGNGGGYGGGAHSPSWPTLQRLKELSRGSSGLRSGHQSGAGVVMVPEDMPVMTATAPLPQPSVGAATVTATVAGAVGSPVAQPANGGAANGGVTTMAMGKSVGGN